MTQRSAEGAPGRTARKRQAILAEGAALFLRNGFRGTGMDEIAAAAGVSKQTVYKQFTDKEALFREIVEGVARNSDTIVARVVEIFERTSARTRDELETTLRDVARAYLDGVLQPRVLSLRRLIIAEADRFPDLAASYYEQAPSRGIEIIAARLAPYADSGLLTADDLRLAAAHFAYLALSVAQDRAMFIPSALPDSSERDRLAAAAARAFMDAYGAARSR